MPRVDDAAFALRNDVFGARRCDHVAFSWYRSDHNAFVAADVGSSEGCLALPSLPDETLCRKPPRNFESFRMFAIRVKLYRAEFRHRAQQMHAIGQHHGRLGKVAFLHAITLTAPVLGRIEFDNQVVKHSDKSSVSSK